MPSVPPRPTCGFSQQKSDDFRRWREASLPAAATDMAGAAHKTPSPGSSKPNTDHTYGQLSTRLGAGEALAPKARRLVHRGSTARSRQASRREADFWRNRRRRADSYTKPIPRKVKADSAGRLFAEKWAQLGLNQRPLACEASALPLSY